MIFYQLMSTISLFLSSFAVSSVFEKMTSHDPDLREMGVRDFNDQLQKENFRIDASSESQLVNKTLELLFDPVSIVQNQVVECMGFMMSKLTDSKINQVIDFVTTSFVEGEEEKEDISNTALLSIVKSLPSEQTRLISSIVDRIIPKLLIGIKKATSTKAQLDGITIITEIIIRFGPLFSQHHEKIQEILLEKVTTFSAPGRCIESISQLAAKENDVLFSKLVKFLSSNLENDKSINNIRAYIQTISQVASNVGYRLGPFLSDIVPKIIKYVGEEYSEDDELRGKSMLAFESFILRSPKEAGEFVEMFLDIALKIITYDPFTQIESDSGTGTESDYSDYTDTESEPESEQEEEEEDEYNDDDFDDTEDVSWKLRRISAKILAGLISTRPEDLGLFYSKALPVLVNRFSENSENVQLDIFDSFNHLLHQTGIVLHADTDSSSLVNQWDAVSEIALSKLTNLLTSDSLKTRVALYTVLRNILLVFPHSFTNLEPIISGIIHSLEDKTPSNSGMKMSALEFLLKAAQELPFKIAPLIDPVLILCEDEYYRISAQALEISGVLGSKIRGQEGWEEIIKKIYKLNLKILDDQTRIQEVKEAVTTSICTLIASVGDIIIETKKIFNMLMDRLNNELMREVTIKGFMIIAESEIELPFEKISKLLLEQLAEFLRQKDRGIKQWSLRTIRAIVLNYYKGKTLDKRLYEKIFSEMRPLVSDSDLHMAHLCLRLSKVVLEADPTPLPFVIKHILPNVYILIQSPILQGIALETLVRFYSQVIKTPKSNFQSLVDPLFKISTEKREEPLPDQAYHSISRCIAVLCVESTEKNLQSVADSLIVKLKGNNQELPLYTLGQIGRLTNLSSYGDRLIEPVIACFDSEEEIVRSAASFSLGGIAIGALESYLQLVLKLIKERQQHKYFLFKSLREIISGSSDLEKLKTYVPTILELLVENCDDSEQGVREVVSECLGKLSLVEPKSLIPKLAEMIKTESPEAKATVVGGLKFAIAKEESPVDIPISENLRTFMSTLEDKNYHVRLAALNTLNYAATNKPSLIRAELSYILPLLYSETIAREELVSVVKIGPLTHIIDKGEENRKSAFSTMDILLTSSYDLLNPVNFLANVRNGLGDTQPDIILASHNLLKRLVRKNSQVVRAALDTLVEPIKVVVTKKLKPDAVQQDIDLNEELVISALLVLAKLKAIPDSEKSPDFAAFLESVIYRDSDLRTKFEAIEQGIIPDPSDVTKSIEYSVTSYT